MIKSNTIALICASVALAGCNSVYIKPNTMEPVAKVHALSGGYSMKRSIKEDLEKRGYTVTVGKNRKLSDSGDIDTEKYELDPDVKYVVKVNERSEWPNPICLFTGIWWWNFNVSIADQETGEEYMTWRGRGCAHSELRKLDRILDELEGKK